jgi:hypothetical protein
VAEGAGSIELVGHSDGHLELVVRDQGSASAQQFGRLTRSGEARGCIITITKSAEESPRLYVNGGESLKLLSDSGESEIKIRGGEPQPVERSYEQLSIAETECASRMAIRKSRMMKKEERAVRPGQRRKTDQEVKAELEGAITRLDHHMGDARDGVREATLGVAGRIRALTYWPNERKTWNPLLLRMAVRLDLPLPVFAEPATELPEVGVPPAQHVRNMVVSCQKVVPTFEIVDLEEYLDRPFETVPADQGGQVTVGQAVAAVANAEEAHYAPDVDQYVDRLQSMKFLEIGVLDRLIVNLGEVVLELSRWVANRIP